MNITSKRVSAIIQRYEGLNNLACDFARYKEPNGRHGEVRIDSNGIDENINTSCHCHPEYEWVHRGTIEEFKEWLDTQ